MSASKAKGTRWETAIVGYLRDRGFPHAERRALNGNRDLGDITGIPGIVIEAKDQQRVSLAEWLDQAETEAANANARVGAVWFKRRGHTSPGRGYVLIDGATFTDLLRLAGWGTDPTPPVPQVPGQMHLADGDL